MKAMVGWTNNNGIYVETIAVRVLKLASAVLSRNLWTLPLFGDGGYVYPVNPIGMAKFSRIAVSRCPGETQRL